MKRSPGLLLMLAISLIFGTPAVSAGEIKCTNVSEKSTTPFKGDSKKLKVMSTAFDGVIPSTCGDKGWQNPLDSWLYGEYYPLFEANIGHVKVGSGGTGLKQFIVNNAQPKINRRVCWDAGEDGSETLDGSGKNVAGFYAFEALKSKGKASDDKKSFELHFLCVASGHREQGLGLDLLNRAFRDAGAGMQQDQSLYGKIVALKSAEGFYEGLTLNCTQEQDDDLTRNLYSREVSIPEEMSEWQAVSRKDHIWTDGCEKVRFNCANLADYHDAVERGLLSNDHDACQARWENGGKPMRDFSALLADNQ